MEAVEGVGVLDREVRAGGDDNPGRQESAPRVSAGQAIRAEARRRPDFAELVQRAFETESEVRTRVPLLMRDETNHCVAPECKSIPQGSKVRIANPNLLASGAKQRLLVSYRGKAYYVLAERESFDFPWE